MPIPAGDLTNLRASGQIVTPHLNVVPKINLGTALVNMAWVNDPTNEIEIDNVSLNGGLTVDTLPPGAMVWVGTSAGDNDVMTTTISYVEGGTADRLFVAGFSSGDPGVAYTGQDYQLLANNQHVTLFGNMPLWAQLSNIYGGVFYKAFDVPYTDEGSDPDPVCNIGGWQRVPFVGASVDVSYANLDSFAWGSKVISSYSWSNRNTSWATTGASVVAGAGTATPTFRFTAAGFYVIICTITDDAGKTHTAYTYIWMDDGTLDLTGWVVTNDVQNRSGRRMTIQMTGDQAQSTIIPGTAFLYSETITANGSSLTSGTAVDTFVGYIDEEKGVRRTETGLVEFDLVSPNFILDQIAMAPQYIIEDASPADWTEVTSDLSHPNGIGWYVLQHHAPNALRVHDYIGLPDVYLRKTVWTLNKKTVWGQLTEILNNQANIGCVSDGGIWFRYNPQYMTAAKRASVETRMTVLAEDLRGDDPLEYPRRYRLEVGQLDIYYSFYSGGTSAQWIRAPGAVQAQGPGKSVINGWLLATNAASRFALADSTTITGHVWANLNNRTPALNLKLLRGTMDVIDPASMVWFQLTIASALDPRGEGYSTEYILPVQVNRSWEKVNDEWLKRITVTVEVETTGQPGLSIPVDVDLDGTWLPENEWPQFGDYPALSPYDPDEFAVPTRIIACHYNSSVVAVARETGGFPGSTPTWTDISDSNITGDCRWLAGDPFAPRRYFLATTEGVFRCDDVTITTPSWNKIYDTGSIPASRQAEGWHYITMTGARQGFILVVNSEGIVDVSYDNGNSWQRSFTNLGANDINYLAHLAISDQSTWSNSYIYLRIPEYVYASDDWGATWVQIAQDTDFNVGGNSFGCGHASVPFNKLGGTQGNIVDATQQMFIVDGYQVFGAADRGATVYRNNVKGGSAGYAVTSAHPTASFEYGGWWSPAMRSVMYNTLDANYMHAVLRQAAQVNWISKCVYSTDNLASRTDCTNQPGYATQSDCANINGWPYNNEFILTWWRKAVGTFGGLKLTDDNGDTAWTDLTGNLVSGGIFADMQVAYAEMMLVDF